MSRTIQILLLSLILVFIGLTGVFAGSSGPAYFDLLALRTALNFRSPRTTTVLVILTEFGRTPVALIPSVVVWGRSRAMSIHLASAALGGWLIGELVKRLIQRPRPVDILPLVGASGYAFPSGHSLVAAATYITVAILAYRQLQDPVHRILIAAATIFLVALVAVSRVYLGVHYASDAIGGILLGTAWAAFLSQVFTDDVRSV
jgi:undecaprenyl-diphosphatase